MSNLTHKEIASNGGKKSWNKLKRGKSKKEISEIMRLRAMKRYNKVIHKKGLAK